MSTPTPYPLTDDTDEWTPDAVFSAVMYRVSSTDEQWDSEPQDWDLSREEAADRLDREDYSPPS